LASLSASSSAENISQKAAAGEKVYSRHGIDSVMWRWKIGAGG
jgi:hypothetical protein